MLLAGCCCAGNGRRVDCVRVGLVLVSHGGGGNPPHGRRIVLQAWPRQKGGSQSTVACQTHGDVCTTQLLLLNKVLVED